jgi:hypothetical protein
MEDQSITKKSQPFNWQVISFFLKALLINAGILAAQWWVVTYMRRESNSIAVIISFMVFFGTLGFSLKIWFYAALAMIVGSASKDD